MVLRVDPEELESEARAIESLAEQFGSDLDTRQSEVEGMNWDGQSREAFVSMFGEARAQFRDVQEQINNIARTLRDAKDGIIDADAQIGAGISR